MSSWKKDARWKASFMALVPHTNLPRITICLSMNSALEYFSRVFDCLAHGTKDITMWITSIRNSGAIVDVDLEWSADGTVARNRFRQIRSVPPGAWNGRTFVESVMILWCPVAVFSLAGSFLGRLEWSNLEVLHLLIEEVIPTAATSTASSETLNIIRCPMLRLIQLQGGERMLKVRKTDIQDFIRRHLDFGRGLVGSPAPHLQHNFTSAEAHLTSEDYQPEILCVSCELLDDDFVSPNHEGVHEVVEGGSIVAEESERNPS